MDKIVTNKWWLIPIIALITYYCCIIIDPNMPTKDLLLTLIIVSGCGGMLLIYLLSTSNHITVRGVIHWKSGEITRSQWFNSWEEFYGWADDFNRENSSKLYDISYELQEETE